MDSWEMAGSLAHSTDLVVSYNGKAFDLEVLEGDIQEGDPLTGESNPIKAIKRKHLDMYVVVREALDAFSPDERLGSGGLDALCRANGLTGKTGEGVDAPRLYAAGRIEELLEYCENDARATAFLYRLARRRGTLKVEPYRREEGGEKVYLDPVELDVAHALKLARERALRWARKPRWGQQPVW